MLEHRVGVLEQTGRIAQSPLQIDLAHFDLRDGTPRASCSQMEQTCPLTAREMVNGTPPD
jgi:hypothetical protein